MTTGIKVEKITEALAVRREYTVAEIEKIGMILAQSKLFGVKTPEEAIALCLIADAEGQHPAMAALDYDIIKGKPALRAKALLARFLASNGKVEWHERTDESVSATFSHPNGGTITVDWNIERAKQAQLLDKDNWQKYPRAMLTARVISEGVGVIGPGSAKMYVPEEVMDFDTPKDVTDKVEVLPPEEKTTPAAATAATATPPKDTTTAKEKVTKATAESKKRTAKATATKAKTAKKNKDFPEAVGEILTDEQVGQIEGAFAKHDISIALLVAWRQLPAAEWTESVRKELLELHKAVKAGDATKDILEALIKGE